MFEITKLTHDMKADENGDYLALTHITFTVTFEIGSVRSQEESGNVLLKCFVKTNCNAENFRNSAVG